MSSSNLLGSAPASSMTAAISKGIKKDRAEESGSHTGQARAGHLARQDAENIQPGSERNMESVDAGRASSAQSMRNGQRAPIQTARPKNASVLTRNDENGGGGQEDIQALLACSTTIGTDADAGAGVESRSPAESFFDNEVVKQARSQDCDTANTTQDSSFSALPALLLSSASASTPSSPSSTELDISVDTACSLFVATGDPASTPSSSACRESVRQPSSFPTEARDSWMAFPSIPTSSSAHPSTKGRQTMESTSHTSLSCRQRPASSSPPPPPQASGFKRVVYSTFTMLLCTAAVLAIAWCNPRLVDPSLLLLTPPASTSLLPSTSSATLTASSSPFVDNQSQTAAEKVTVQILVSVRKESLLVRCIKQAWQRLQGRLRAVLQAVHTPFRRFRQSSR